jgi:hypothetical protein
VIGECALGLIIVQRDRSSSGTDRAAPSEHVSVSHTGSAQVKKAAGGRRLNVRFSAGSPMSLLALIWQLGLSRSYQIQISGDELSRFLIALDVELEEVPGGHRC